MIPLDQVALSARRPFLAYEFNTRAASQGLPRNDQKVLLIGVMTAAGTAAASSVRQMMDDVEGEALFGPGSPLDLMVKAAFRANPNVPIFAVTVAEPAAGTQAQVTVTVAGTATSSGGIVLRIAGRRVEVAVASGDLAAAIATAISAAVNGAVRLPVAATTADAVSTLKAKAKGTYGNEIRVEAELVGLTGVTVTLGGAVLSGGLLAADIAAALTAVAAERYHLIALGQTDNGASGTASRALREHLTTYAGPMSARGQAAVIPEVLSQSAANTLAGALNHERCQVVCIEGTASLGCELAAAWAAVRAGRAHPALPLNGVEAPGIEPPKVPDRFIVTELESQLVAGVTPFVVNANGNVSCVRSVTTRTKDASSNPDLALYDTPTMASLDYARDAVAAHHARVFADKVYADEDPDHELPEEIVVTNADIVEETMVVLMQLQAFGVVQKVKANASKLAAEKDPAEPTRARVSIPYDIIPCLHQIGGRFNVRVL